MNKYLVLAASILVMYSCSSDSSEDTSPATLVQQNDNVPTTDSQNQLVTYEKDIAPLIANRCFRCHNDPVANGAPRGTSWINFAIVSERAASINTRIANGTMPPSGGLAQAERDLVAQWITDGMPEK